MKTRKKLKRLSVGLAGILILTMLPVQDIMATQQTKNGKTEQESAVEADAIEEIIIRDVDDFLAFADNCYIDSWSIDKRIILEKDIDLSGTGFQMLPVFAGTFDGLGHTISGYENSDNGYVVGLFRYIEKDGVVQNLKLKGAIAGAGEKECIGSLCGVNYGMIKNCSFQGTVSGRDTVGGIVGVNESTGTITRCATNGRVTGYYMTGGVTGVNHGVITNCTNRAGINDDSEWVEEDDEMGTGIFFSITVSETDTELYSGVDTGGVAGYSDGLISECTNFGRVGYEHTGYNIGGIAGRQAGVVSLCTNNGEVYGRKDVGGIVGQMEPYIEINEAESLRNAVNKLHDLIDKTIDDMQAGKDTVKTDLDNLNVYADAALESGDSLAEQLTDFVDDNIAQTQAITERMEHVVELLPAIMEDVSNAGDAFQNLNSTAKQMAEDLDIIGKLDDSPYVETDYRKVSLLSTVGGELECDNTNPSENDVVTITAVPDSGYKLTGTPTATDANGRAVAVVKIAENEYTVVMPSTNIKIVAYFAYDENQPDTTSLEEDTADNQAYSAREKETEKADGKDVYSSATIKIEPENENGTTALGTGRGGSIKVIPNADNSYTIEIRPEEGYELADDCLEIGPVLSGQIVSEQIRTERTSSVAVTSGVEKQSYDSYSSFGAGFDALATPDFGDTTKSRTVDGAEADEASSTDSTKSSEESSEEGSSSSTSSSEESSEEGSSSSTSSSEESSEEGSSSSTSSSEESSEEGSSSSTSSKEELEEESSDSSSSDEEEPDDEESSEEPETPAEIIKIKRKNLRGPVDGVYTYQLDADAYDAEAFHVTANFKKTGERAGDEHTIEKSKSGGGRLVVAEKANAGDTVLVSATPSDGYMLTSVTVEDASGTAISCTKQSDGKHYSFTMPDADVKVTAKFERIKVILSSNLSGSASYSANANGIVTLTVKPDAAYTLSGNPVVTDANGRNIPLSRKQSGAYVYEFNMSGVTAPCYVKITFQTQNKQQAMDTSKDNIGDDINELQEASDRVEKSVKRINELMTDEDGNPKEWSDLSNAEQDEVLEEIANLSEYLGDMSTAASSVLSNLGVIGNILMPYMSDAMEAAKRDIDEATDHVQSIINSLKNATSGVKGIVNYMNAQPDIKFAQLGENFDASREVFHDQLQGISDSLKSLSDNASDYSDIINEDLRAVNDQLNVVFNLLTDHLVDYSEISVEELYEEVSDDEIDTITTGRADDCTNKGIVKGDINIGGIAGAMSIDEEDPEDSAAGSVEYQIGRRFITKCIITRSVNEGYVTARKDGAGGIVGYMKHGVVLDSEGYGSVESTEGDYAGGICGESLTVIKRCYALCSVSGNKNVGGIAGYADTLKDCYAIVDVAATAGRKGAIAGQVTSYENTYEKEDEAAKVSGNYYVGDDLYGVDNISYVGIAEPISYEELLTVENLPTTFWHLKVIYRIEDTYLGSQEVAFGESLADLQYPQIPEREGYYGVWPNYTEEIMKGNLVINGEYRENVTVVESTEKYLESAVDEYQKPYALVEQIFTEDTVLNVAISNMTPPEAARNKEHIIYDISLENSTIGDADTFAVRVLNPYEDAVVWEYRDGVWTECESKLRGQYLQVEMTGNRQAFCVIEQTADKRIFIVVAVAAGGMILLIILIKKGHSRRQKKRKGKKASTVH